MLAKFRRPSPALVISLIALFAALGGTVYAAGNKINGKSIKLKSLPGNRLKLKSLPGNRVKPNSITGRQVKESSLGQVPSAKKADNATKVNGHTAACGDGTMLFAGACWETTARAAATAPSAAETCTKAGGTLPDPLSLRSFALNSGVALANTDEWSSNVHTVTLADNYTVVFVHHITGAIDYTASTDLKQYRCVLPLVR